MARSPLTNTAECALLSVKVQVEAEGHREIQAIAVLGDWAATESLQHTGRYVITHVRTGLKTGPHMTARDAMRTVAKLRAVSVGSTDELRAQRDVIIAAHPRYARPTGTGDVRPLETHLLPEYQ